MKGVITILLFCGVFCHCHAQPLAGPKSAALKPYSLRGNHLFRRNLSFPEYRTTHFRRTVGSYFRRRPFLTGNVSIRAFGLPVYYQDRYRSKDIFSFDLIERDSVVSHVACKSKFQKNETFNLFGKQDSSFYGGANKDELSAVITFNSDTGTSWQLSAFNLNGSRNEQASGIIKHGADEISFVLRTLLLPDQPAAEGSVNSLFISSALVYAFTWRDEIVGAVSFRKDARRIWLKDGLQSEVRNVIISASCLLTFRRNLYQ